MEGTPQRAFTHRELFAADAPRCSVCDTGLHEREAEEESRFEGRGLLLFTRGTERRYEEPRLCVDCASVIGLAALQRWELEEDEG